MVPFIDIQPDPQKDIFGAPKASHAEKKHTLEPEQKGLDVYRGYTDYTVILGFQRLLN